MGPHMLGLARADFSSKIDRKVAESLANVSKTVLKNMFYDYESREHRCGALKPSKSLKFDQNRYFDSGVNFPAGSDFDGFRWFFEGFRPPQPPQTRKCIRKHLESL